jgi:DNA-binding CsgD family transcriptional regulator
MPIDGFTPTQTRILRVLADGMPHRPEELVAAIGDSESTVENLWPHLTRIRGKLRPRGEDILCQFILRRVHYRHVRLLAHAGDD